ncbi:hypothetical protein M3Y98_00406400 [Aphelenchoides besseyi]|nr:hypothetical protein M3Y98_00406400 [Aphelenchoides besseyi]
MPLTSRSAASLPQSSRKCSAQKSALRFNDRPSRPESRHRERSPRVKQSRSRASLQSRKRSPPRRRSRSPVRRSTARSVNIKPSWLTQPIYSCYDSGDSSPSHVNPILWSTLNSSQMSDNFAATLNSISFHALEMPSSYGTQTSQFANSQRPSTETDYPRNNSTQESRQGCLSRSNNLNGIEQPLNTTEDYADWIDSVLIDRYGDHARQVLRRLSHDRPTNAPVQDSSINTNFSVGSSDNGGRELQVVESPQPNKPEEQRKTIRERKRSKSRDVEKAKRPRTEADLRNNHSHKAFESSSKSKEVETPTSKESFEPMMVETLKKDVELQFVQWHVEEPNVQNEQPATPACGIEPYLSLEEGEIYEDSEEFNKTTSKNGLEEVIQISDSDTEETKTTDSDDDIIFIEEVKGNRASVTTREHLKEEVDVTVQVSAKSTVQPPVASSIESKVEVALEIVRKPVLEPPIEASVEVPLQIAVEAFVESTVEPDLETPTVLNVESVEIDITNSNQMTTAEEQNSATTSADKSEQSSHQFRYFPAFLDLDNAVEEQVTNEETTTPTATPLSNIFRNIEIYNDNECELIDCPIIDDLTLDTPSDTEIQWPTELSFNEAETELTVQFTESRASSYVEFVVPEQNKSNVQIFVSAPPERSQLIDLEMLRLIPQEVITLDDDEPNFSKPTPCTSTTVNQNPNLPRNHLCFPPHRARPTVVVPNTRDYRKDSLNYALKKKEDCFLRLLGVTISIC